MHVDDPTGAVFGVTWRLSFLGNNLQYLGNSARYRHSYNRGL